MSRRKNIGFSLILFAFIIHVPILAHPTGNMITAGTDVIWSYIDPIDDPEHHACVMIWRKNAEPDVLLSSEFPASDYMLYNKGNDIYLIERRTIQSSEKFAIRLLKMRIGGAPVEIWSWFEDDMRIGEGGFFMKSDNQIVFGRFPNIYSLTKGGRPIKYFDFDSEINRIRHLENQQILLLGKNTCWLVEQNGKIIKKWNDLIDQQIKNAPLNRNQIFDADYKNGELLLAYWGKRSFEIISDYDKRETILQQSQPLVPHWVCFYGRDLLLFSSQFVFNGENPKPQLLLFKSNGETSDVWVH